MKTLIMVITSIGFFYEDIYASSPEEGTAIVKSHVFSVTATLAPNDSSEESNMQSRESRTPINYLELRANVGEKYVISMCPINSSGDIYHILAYIILSKNQNKEIPSIVLTYDGSNTLQKLESKMNSYSQMKRSQAFCDWIGYSEHFRTLLRIETGKNQRQNNRQSKLVKALFNNGFTHFVDQKALTNIIVPLFGLDDTRTKLRDGFSRMNETEYPDLLNVKKAAKLEIEKIKQHKGEKPLIVIHIRYSSNANNTQNPLISSTHVDLIKYLEIENKIWFIFADGRARGSFAGITENRSNVFPYLLPNDQYDGKRKTDYGKFYHLQILLGLLEVHDVRFVGNTSGTLDVAAFIGHKVYNLHNLVGSINYQTARILIQSAFLTVECVKCQMIPTYKKDGSPKIKKNGKPEKEIALASGNCYSNLLNWLTDPDNLPPNSHVGDSTPHRSKAGYRELYFILNLKGSKKTYVYQPIQQNEDKKVEVKRMKK